MITSTSNAQIKELAKLQKKSRLRDERRIFLVGRPEDGGRNPERAD